MARALGLLFFLVGAVYDLDGALGEGVVVDALLGKRMLGVCVAIGVSGFICAQRPAVGI